MNIEELLKGLDIEEMVKIEEVFLSEEEREKSLIVEATKMGIEVINCDEIHNE